jgi:hypothetical protein
MPMFHKVVRHLNRRFDDDNIGGFSTNIGAFEPGRPLNVEVLEFHDPALARLFQSYLNGLPDGLREVLRAVFHHALSAKPPIPLSFSWAPAYAYEMTVWQPECGIMIQFRGPTPNFAEAS